MAGEGLIRSDDVVVLGAGFSRAITEWAPTMSEFLDTAQKAGVYDPHKQTELANAVALYFGDYQNFTNANIETLATFLCAPSYEPRYFWDYYSQIDRPLVNREQAYRELLEVINMTLSKAGECVFDFNNPVFHRFAQNCVAAQIGVITFNYDLIFDQLCLRQPSGNGEDVSTPAWEPHYGYGFGMSVAGKDELGSLTYDPPAWRGSGEPKSAMALLKLHGSLNWGIRNLPLPDGRNPPEVVYKLKSLQNQDWIPAALAPDVLSAVSDGAVIYEDYSLPSYHLDPLIIPPILNKNPDEEHSFIRNIWYSAVQKLAGARRVFVLGYSLPPADFPASNLFREAFSCPHPDRAQREIYVVDKYNATGVKEKFEKLVGNLADGTFVHARNEASADYLAVYYT